MQTDMIALFHTITDVFRAERVLKGYGFEVQIVPVPRHLSSDCGVAIVARSVNEGRLKDILDSASINYSGLFKVNE